MDSLLINFRFRAFSFTRSMSNVRSVESYHCFSFSNFNNPKRSSIEAISANTVKPNSQWGNRSSSIRPFSSLLPVIKKLKDFAVKASKIKWVSSFYGLNKLERLSTGFEGRFLEKGALGMALMSVTSTARVKISPFVATLAANPTFVSGLFAWVIAQSIKVFLNFWVERKWDLKIMFASGGMPSSHSALCTALTTSVAICHGVADSLFPVCLGFSLIVMYDAIGVRRHAGMQAEVFVWFLYFNMFSSSSFYWLVSGKMPTLLCTNLSLFFPFDGGFGREEWGYFSRELLFGFLNMHGFE